MPLTRMQFPLFRLALAVVVSLGLLAGCKTAPPAPPTNAALPFDEAVAQATDGAIAQASKLPAFLANLEAKVARRITVLDPTLDAGTGQQTAGTQRLDKAIGDRIAAKHEGYELLPFRPANLARAQWLLTGTLTRVGGNYVIGLALTDIKSGTVLGQASAVASGQGVDMSPLAYYRDSPVLTKDKIVDGYIRTSSTPAGGKADATYLERIATASVINEANTLYNAEKYTDALGQYRSALASPAGEQLRVLNGIYLSNVKLGRLAEAETAFGRVVALGIASNQLGVKFLFNPGSTEFWSDARISGQYAMWLRQIAKEANASRACMDVVGHTSKTGTESANDALSLRRAETVRQRLVGESASLGPRTKASGRGFRENIVGSGSDDAVDALDRRVEFRIVACG
jgi:outer membrane protein OmpA-like peptidoglycan-associated protein